MDSKHCKGYMVPPHFNSARSAYELWLRTNSNADLPKTGVGENGLDISIFQKKDLLQRFKRIISRNSHLSQYFNRRVLSFVEDFRGDLNIDKARLSTKTKDSRDLITQKEFNILAERLLSRESARSVVVDIAIAVQLINNIQRLDIDNLKFSTNMRESYFASLTEKKSILPEQNFTVPESRKVACFRELSQRHNPSLLKSWNKVVKGAKNRAERLSFWALFSSMQVSDRTPKSVNIPESRPVKLGSASEIKKAQPTTPKFKPKVTRIDKKKNSGSGKVVKRIVGITLTVIVILLFVLI